MNKRERVIAAFRGEEVDHVPVCMWKHVPQEFRNDEDKFVESQANSYKVTDVDFMKLSGDNYFGWPHSLLDRDMKAADLYKLEPLGENHPYIRGQIRRTGKVVRAIGDECVKLYLIFAPLSCIRLKIGYPAMMRLIREDPEAMKYACAVVAEDQKTLLRGILQDAGVDGIFYSVQNGEENRFTFDEYRAWVTPSDKTVLDYANSLSELNAIHFCAWEEIPNRLAVWHDYKAPVISWSRFIDVKDIAEAKKLFGTTVWGGFDNRSGTELYTLSREELEKRVASLIAEGGKKGYILGADCSIHDELPEERISWVAQAARKL